MVQVIENRSVVTCEVVGAATKGPHEDWVSVPVSVVGAEAVEGFPNLFAEGLPRRMTALVRRDTWTQDLAGDPLWRAEAELVGPGRIRVRHPA